MGITINGKTIIGGNISGVTIVNGQVIGGGQGKTVDGNGQVAEKKREVEQQFDSVSISGGIKANIQVGKPNDGVNLKGESNLLSEIETRVEDGKLHIGPKEDTQLNPNSPIEATLFVADLTGINASTSAAVKATGLAARRLRLKATTSSSIEVSGSAENVKAKASTSGQISAKGLEAGDVDATASTSGTVMVSPHGELDASASTSGQVYYFAEPTSVHKSTSTSGQVRSLI